MYKRRVRTFFDTISDDLEMVSYNSLVSSRLDDLLDPHHKSRGQHCRTQNGAEAAAAVLIVASSSFSGVKMIVPSHRVCLIY
jgi:hypothetical protein